MCKISLVIPIYNVAPFLRWCLDSVVKQSFRDLEVILVNDGSTDGSGVICDEYVSANDNFKVIHVRNQGVSAARNTGTALASGEYIGYIDSDDIVHPDYFKILYDAIISTGTKVAYCHFQNITEDVSVVTDAGITDKTATVAGRDAVKDIVMEHLKFMIVAQGKLYHNSLKSQLVYPVGKINEDEFVTYRVLYERERVAVCYAPIYGYRQRRNSIMHTPSPRTEILEALKGAITYFEDRQDEELAVAARRRYLLNIQLAWYRVSVTTKDRKLMAQLKKVHDEFYRENKNKIGKLNFMEISELFTFNLSVHLFKLICRIVTYIKWLQDGFVDV